MCFVFVHFSPASSATHKPPSDLGRARQSDLQIFRRTNEAFISILREGDEVSQSLLRFFLVLAFDRS